MSNIKWDPALETHESEIDDQHRRLFALASDLQEACDLCEDTDRIGEAVFALSDYVLEHFRDEESYMMRCGYPEIGPHRAMHDYLSGRTLQYTARHLNGEEQSVESLATFLVEWLTHHILAEDMRVVVYCKHMAERALA